MTSEHYEKLAYDAREQARLAPSDDLRTSWFELANVWLLMASDATRPGALEQKAEPQGGRAAGQR